MATSVIDTCILSLPPIELAHIFNGTYDTLCMFQAASMLDYKGPLLLHTLPNLSPDTQEEAKILLVCKEILADYGETWEDYPSLCLMGQAYIKNVEMYTATTFEEDAENHGNFLTMTQFQANSGFGTSEVVYGIRLHRIEQLLEPVIDLMPPQEVSGTAIWQPRTPMQMEAVKTAKKSKLIKDTPETEAPS